MTNAQHLSHLFAQERRLQAELRKVERQIKDERVTFCESLGYRTVLRREDLERAVESELARGLSETPLEHAIATGKAFDA